MTTSPTGATGSSMGPSVSK